jgi:signal transduction histidine kinase/ActR/RegA family two-component response regulator
VIQPKSASNPHTSTAVPDRPEGLSSLGSVWLVALFFLGFLSIIGLNQIFSNLVDDLAEKSSNEQARLFIGEEITRSIKEIEMDVYRMATTIGTAAQGKIQIEMLKQVEKLEHDLLVLRDGGTVQQVIHLNVEGMDEMVRQVQFQPDAEDKRYIMELIELRPHLTQIKEKSNQLRSLLERREGYHAQQDHEELFAMEKEIKDYLKRIPSFFFRLNENANRLFFESQHRLQELEGQLAAQRYRYKTTELFLNILILLAVMGIGILFIRHINQSNGKLLQAWLEMSAARDEAEQASRAKSDFVSRMSHELRTPLNAILGFSQLLEQKQLSPPHSGYIQEINKAGNHLLELINQVLDLAKIEAGRLSLEHIAFDVAQTVDEVASIISGRAKSKGLDVKVSYSRELPRWIKGDPVRIRQILINLLGNALKFTDSGEIGIRVKADVGRSHIRFEVWDTGIGLESSEAQRLFQPFTQADESITRKYGGTGLGLRISKELIEAMSGTIQVESVPGQGCCFWFTLPLDVASAPLQAPELMTADDSVVAPKVAQELAAAATPSKGYPPGRGHVLLVEDNQVNQLVAASMLNVLGITCEIANNGMEALEKLVQHHYDLVLMDVEMPVMDGYTATHQIRLREQQMGHSPIPIIAMTANAMSEDRANCLTQGMDEHLAKPVSITALTEVMERWLSNQGYGTAG